MKAILGHYRDLEGRSDTVLPNLDVVKCFQPLDYTVGAGSRIRENAVSQASEGLDRESMREAEGLTDVWFRWVLGVPVQK